MGSAPSHSLHLITEKSVAEAYLRNAERLDFYLEECHDSPMNLIARQKLVYAPNTVANAAHYQDVLKRLVIPSRLRMDLPDVSIISLMPSADAGMPHTRPGNIICVPHLEQLTSKQTMIHELWHLHQRQYHEGWEKIFSLLGWAPWKGELPARLEENRRLNPDTLDAPLWIFQDTWIPVPIFRDIRNPVLSEADIWFYHAKEGHHLRAVPLSLQSLFPAASPMAFEHPRELTAYVLSEPDMHRDAPGWKILMDSIGQGAII